MYYQIAVSVTVEAETESEAREYIGQCLTASLAGEPGPIIDYSLEELQDEYDGPEGKELN